jgi:hypothetical protein
MREALTLKTAAEAFNATISLPRSMLKLREFILFSIVMQCVVMWVFV